jgi:hypothetical protein
VAGSLPRLEVSQVEVTGVYSLLGETCCVGGEVEIVVLKEELSELARSMVPTLTASATTSAWVEAWTLPESLWCRRRADFRRRMSNWTLFFFVYFCFLFPSVKYSVGT